LRVVNKVFGECNRSKSAAEIFTENSESFISKINNIQNGHNRFELNIEQLI